MITCLILMKIVKYKIKSILIKKQWKSYLTNYLFSTIRKQMRQQLNSTRTHVTLLYNKQKKWKVIFSSNFFNFWNDMSWCKKNKYQIQNVEKTHQTSLSNGKYTKQLEGINSLSSNSKTSSSSWFSADSTTTLLCNKKKSNNTKL